VSSAVGRGASMRGSFGRRAGLASSRRSGLTTLAFAAPEAT
jgi:hypothetical protein